MWLIEPRPFHAVTLLYTDVRRATSAATRHAAVTWATTTSGYMWLARARHRRYAATSGVTFVARGSKRMLRRGCRQVRVNCSGYKFEETTTKRQVTPLIRLVVSNETSYQWSAPPTEHTYRVKWCVYLIAAMHKHVYLVSYSVQIYLKFFM